MGLKVAVSPQVCFAIWTSMMNIHALRNTAGDKATAQPTSGNIQMFISICNFKICHCLPYPNRTKRPPESQAIRPGSVRTEVSISAWQCGQTCIDRSYTSNL